MHRLDEQSFRTGSRETDIYYFPFEKKTIENKLIYLNSIKMN
jgi:hypothetical protein